MKYQPMKRIDCDKIRKIVSDHQGITAEEIAEKTGIPYPTIKTKVKILVAKGRVFRQIKSRIRPLFTTQYAKVNRIPEVFEDKPVMNELEQQLWFNDLTRGLAL